MGFSGGRTLTKILPLVLLFLPYPSSRALPNFSRPSPPASSSCQQQFGSDSSLFPLRWIWLLLLSLLFFFNLLGALKSQNLRGFIPGSGSHPAAPKPPCPTGRVTSGLDILEGFPSCLLMDYGRNNICLGGCSGPGAEPRGAAVTNFPGAPCRTRRASCRELTSLRLGFGKRGKCCWKVLFLSRGEAEFLPAPRGRSRFLDFCHSHPGAEVWLRGVWSIPKKKKSWKSFSGFCARKVPCQELRIHSGNGSGMGAPRASPLRGDLPFSMG